ncbi:MAG: PAS domain S-box protein [Planctomycetota bacterium]
MRPPAGLRDVDLWQLFEGSPIGMIVTGPDGTFEHVNPRLAEMLGRDREELVGRSFREFTHPDDLEASEAQLRRLQRGDLEGTRSFEKRYMRKDGSVLYALLTVQPFADEAGRTRGFLTQVLELDEQKRRQRVQAGQIEVLALVARGARLDRVFERILEVSEQLTPGLRGSLHLLSPDRRRLMRGISRSLPPAYLDITDGLEVGVGVGSCGTAVATRRPCIVEDVGAHEYWREASGIGERFGFTACWSIPFLDSDGEPLGTFGMYFPEARTPTPAELEFFGSMAHVAGIAVERDKLEEELLQSRKLEAIGQLAGGVAHDFNNLLTGLLGNAELLARSLPEGTEDAQLAERVVQIGQRAADLTTKLLSFARKGRQQLRPVDVDDCIREVAALCERSFDKQIEIRTRLAGHGRRVVGDPGELHNCLLNLALNARDAMPQGGLLELKTDLLDAGQQHVRDAARAEWVQLRVCDDGEGMDAETQERAFEPFFTTKEVGKGTGLGLSGVYGTVKSHGGEIRLRSEPGKGSCFTILLPLAPEGAREAGAEQPQGAPVGQPARILVVDDEEAVRAMATKALGKAGYEVEACPDGASALERYDPVRHDLVLLDSIMPGMSGEQVLAELRARDPAVRVLLSSGYRQETEDPDDASGVVGFLRKPYGLTELRGAVARALAEGREA